MNCSGKRCVLENYKNAQGKTDNTCKTLEVLVEKLPGYIEIDQYVNACGVHCEFKRISSEAFLSSEFTAHLCSPACYQNCPNIVDLFFNLVVDEGVSLPTLRKNQKENHRAILEILSNGGANSGPMAAPAPSYF
ncbi:hypothetical protein Sango_0051000 [Sesamum angolense]|uniref:Uncharacterized protein n=1 Tax=Sesamum angolense TaxID=2727404 RepID=A0AAE1XDF3_9LAMI|nr:hypothetical protein Sango_0051000 [Sesamum angolense]